jgi:ABC-type glycerol-3-phosphate transport system substrate-binding protein
MQKVEGLEFESLPFPGTPKCPRVTTYKSNIIAISASTKKEKAAWKFLKFLRAPGERGEILYMQAKRIPPTVDDPKLWEIFADPTKSPKRVAEVTQLIAKSYAHLLPLRSGWMEITGELLPQLQRIYAGQISAERGMKEIAPKIQAIMNRTNH